MKSIFDQYESEIELNSKTIKVNITIHTIPECDDVDGSFDFGNETDNQEYLSKFESGELESVIISVKASALGISATDNLGQCHVRSSKFSDDIRDLIKDYSMATNALTELKKNIKEQANRLSEYSDAATTSKSR